MIPQAVRDKYLPTIGIECHVQFNTATKLFAAVGNDARTAPPNTLISHICMGLPGALPVLNVRAVELAVRAALAFGTEPSRISTFDRKHYFYPDLPSGYQITQYERPVIADGTVVITVGGHERRIGITRAHLEADAGKSSHPPGKDYSLVDLNRAGTPLLEIVSEPAMHSAEEAKAYAKELYLLMRYADVSDCDLYHGNMRFDVNVSVSSEPGTLGTRTETKNLNSFRSVEKAVEYEISRQIELLEKGELVVQETRGWDDAKQKTVPQRSKEDAHDYRYFPDPDLPPVIINADVVAAARLRMPLMPQEWRTRLRSLGIDGPQMETLLLAEIEDAQVSYLPLIAEHMDEPAFATALANWFVNIEIPCRRNQGVAAVDEAGRKRLLRGLYELTAANKLSSTNAKSLLVDLLRTGVLPADLERYADEQGYLQLTDQSELEVMVGAVLAENPRAADEIRNGEVKAIGFLVGQVMKRSSGKADPALTQHLIRQRLGR